MQELRFVAVSEDGSYAVLAVPGRSGRYILPIDERLRAVAQGQASRLAQYEIEVESPLRPKEIQARIRAGETAEEIADAAGIPVERVRWFEGPVLAERAYIADQAQAGSVRRAGDSSGPGPRLGDIVTARLSAAGTDPVDGQWDSRKRGDGNWQVSLTFPSGGRLHVAEWVFDPRRRHVMPDDDNAARLSLPESELPAEPVPMPGEATVTPIASRLGAAAAGVGGGSVAGPGVSRFRPERSVIPDRSLGIDRSLVERPAPPPVPAPERTPAPDRPALSDRPAVPDLLATPDRFSTPERPAAPAPPRPEQQDRPSYEDRPGYAEFPESAPYRAPESASEYRDPGAEPPAHRAQETGRRDYDDSASVSSAYRAQVPQPSAYREAAPEPRAYRDPVPEAAPYRAPSIQQPAYREPAPQQPAYRDPAPEPAAQVSPAPAFEDSERGQRALPRPVIFEDPEPAFLDDQPEPVQDLAPAQPAPTLPPAPQPVAAAPATQPAPPATPPAAAPPAAPVPAGEVPAPAAEQAPPAAAASAAPAVAAVTQPEKPAEPVAASSTATMPAAETVMPAEAAVRAEQATTREPAAPAVAEPTGSTLEPALATPEPVPATPQPAAGVSAPAEPAPAEDQSGRPRPGAKKNVKARRSSVPSWDEIMLGSSRQRD